MFDNVNSSFKNDKGFSLLELVVAVGVVLVLTAIGLLAYNGITNNARKAAVSKAATEVYDSTMARYSGADEGSPTDVDDEWNETAGSDSNVKTEVNDLGNGRYEVKAWYGESYENAEHKTSKTTPGENGNSAPNDEDGGNNNNEPIVSGINLEVAPTNIAFDCTVNELICAYYKSELELHMMGLYYEGYSPESIKYVKLAQSGVSPEEIKSDPEYQKYGEEMKAQTAKKETEWKEALDRMKNDPEASRMREEIDLFIKSDDPAAQRYQKASSNEAYAEGFGPMRVAIMSGKDPSPEEWKNLEKFLNETVSSTENMLKEYEKQQG